MEELEARVKDLEKSLSETKASLDRVRGERNSFRVRHGDELTVHDSDASLPRRTCMITLDTMHAFMIRSNAMHACAFQGAHMFSCMQEQLGVTRKQLTAIKDKLAEAEKEGAKLLSKTAC